MAFNIFRPLNSQESQEMNEIGPRGQTSILNSFSATLADISAKYHKTYRPYDAYGARLDFELRMKNRLEEIQKTVDPSKINVSMDFGDLDKYAEPDRFEYVKRTEVVSARLVMGMKQEIHIGYRFHFKGKERGNRISMFVPSDDIEKVQSWINTIFKIDVEKEETKLMVVDEVPVTLVDKRLGETNTTEITDNSNK